jgi:hypothetical protein
VAASLGEQGRPVRAGFLADDEAAAPLKKGALTAD